MQGDGIHIALHQDQVSQFTFLRQIQGKQVFSFVENQGFRGVQIFGRRLVLIAHDPSAKTNHIPPDIDDGKHQPVTETVEQIPVFSGNGHQSGIPQFLIGVAFFSQGIRQIRPTVRGIADAKSGQGGFCHAPSLGIGQRFLANRSVELLVEKPGCFLVQRPKALLLPVTALVLLIFRDLHPGTLGQGTDCVRVAQALNLHLEINDASTLVAAEAIVNSLVRRHRKGRGLFPMERTQAKQVGAGALQAHIFPNHIFNWIAGSQLV